VRMPPDPTLDMLDSALNRFISFCASYHGTCEHALRLLQYNDIHIEQYLQTQLQIEHACEILLDSELFTWHSARMTDILLRAACKVHSPFSNTFFTYRITEYGPSPPTYDRARSSSAWPPHACLSPSSDSLATAHSPPYGCSIRRNR
jgi:hypothetical protein